MPIMLSKYWYQFGSVQNLLVDSEAQVLVSGLKRVGLVHTWSCVLLTTHRQLALLIGCSQFVTWLISGIKSCLSISLIDNWPIRIKKQQDFCHQKL